MSLRSILSSGLRMRPSTVLLLICCVLVSLLVCPSVQSDSFYLYYTANASKFTWGGSGTGQWADTSSDYCGSNYSRYCYLTTSSFTVAPTFGTTGGYYDVSVIHANQYRPPSTNLRTNCSVTSGATAYWGDILTGYTSTWNNNNSACANNSIGIIKLNSGSSTATLSFSYKDGTLTSSNRWNVVGLYFAQAYSVSTAGAGGTVTQSGSGYYPPGAPVTVTALPNSGYAFWEWRDSGGTSLTTNPSYTFTMPSSNVVLTPVFVQNGVWIHTAVNPTGTGTATGDGVYTSGGSCTLTATPALGYHFVKWTSDQAGASQLSTANPYSYPVSGAATVYAQFAGDIHTLTRSACPGGTVSGSSGSFATGTQVTMTATPSGTNIFTGWSTNTCGGTVVSMSPSYTFSMPPNDLDLHGNFSAMEMIETFESYSTGGTSYDSVDKNDTVGPNFGTNGAGNPWWGPNPPNGRIDNALAHGGTQSLWGTAGNCKDVVNLQSRFNNGAAFAGNIFLDWWFYDPLGSGGTTADFCGDYTALSYYSGMATTSDYIDPAPNPFPASVQQLAIGMSDDFSAGYDPAKYQIRVQGDTTGYANGWFNTPLVRSIGWHHARVVVGPKKAGVNTNDVCYYIDNMLSPVAGPRDSKTTNGYNILEVNTIMPTAGSCASDNGCIYSRYLHYSAVDDIDFSTTATPPTVPVATVNSPTQVSWGWTTSADAAGSSVWDALGGGNLKAAVPAPGSSFVETGLPANTRISRWVDSYANRYCGTVDGNRVSFPITYTWALTPIFGSSGDGAVNCNNGPGSATAKYAIGTPTVFTSVNGFGSGPSKVGKYVYIWNTSPSEPTAAEWSHQYQWGLGDLSEMPLSGGSYYLHLRSCNAIAVQNTTALTLGPYTYKDYTLIDKISDLWPLDDNTPYLLTNKTVSATWSDGFWIEETGRFAGIKVQWTGTPAVAAADLVDVYGQLSTADERTMQADYVIKHDPTDPPNPAIPALGMIAARAGGKAASTKTPGALSGSGLYSVGLLVRMAGNAGGAGADFFYLDDGSGLIDGPNQGIRVLCGDLTPPASGYQVVTGVVGISGGKQVLYALSITPQ